MLNYIKSEIYRVTRSSVLYMTVFCFAAIPVLFNLVLFCFMKLTPDFRYATTSYSYSNIVANPMIFCAAALFSVYIFYEGEKKNGNIKNVIAFGISREKILMGQLVVSALVSMAILVITEAAYILSAVLLLKNEGPVTAADMMHETFVILPIAAAALIFGITVMHIFEKVIVGLAVWYGVFYLVPQILFYIGMKIEAVRNIAMWMPRNFFSGMEVNMSVCMPVWDMREGLFKCLISGFLGIIIFGIIGICSIRKKEI